MSVNGKPSFALTVYGMNPYTDFEWQLSLNGRTLARSAQFYSRRPDAVKAARAAVAKGLTGGAPVALRYERFSGGQSAGWATEVLNGDAE